MEQQAQTGLAVDEGFHELVRNMEAEQHSNGHNDFPVFPCLVGWPSEGTTCAPAAAMIPCVQL